MSTLACAWCLGVLRISVFLYLVFDISFYYLNATLFCVIFLLSVAFSPVILSLSLIDVMFMSCERLLLLACNS